MQLSASRPQLCIFSLGLLPLRQVHVIIHVNHLDQLSTLKWHLAWGWCTQRKCSRATTGEADVEHNSSAIKKKKINTKWSPVVWKQLPWFLIDFCLYFSFNSYNFHRLALKTTTSFNLPQHADSKCFPDTFVALHQWRHGGATNKPLSADKILNIRRFCKTVHFPTTLHSVPMLFFFF